MVMSNGPLRLVWLIAGLALGPVCEASAQAMATGVVKIRNNVMQRTGSGYVQRLVPGRTAVIVTLAHVIENEPKPMVTFVGDVPTTLPGSVIAQQDLSDSALALISVDGAIPANVNELALDEFGSVANGERVAAVGFPIRLRTPWAVSEVQVVGRRDGSTMVLSGLVNEGHSGGPILKGGRVVGVIYGGVGANGVGYAVPAAIVRAALDGWLKGPGGHTNFCFVLERLASMAQSNFETLRGGPALKKDGGKSWKVPDELDLTGMRGSTIEQVRGEHEFYVGWMGAPLSRTDMPRHWQNLVERVRGCKPEWKVSYERQNEARFEGPLQLGRGKIVIEVGYREADQKALAYVGIGNWFKGPYGR